MRFDRRFAVVVGLSLVWALVVSVVFYRVAVRASAGSPLAEKSLVVAARDLPMGATVMADMIKVVGVPAKLFPSGGFSRAEEVLNRPVISAIMAGEPLLDARLAARGSGVGLAPLIPPGMRAVSVRVNDVVGVAGFVLPGMRVDVLVTGRPPGRDDTFTTTVLQDIAVLSAGQTIQADAKSQPINTPVVTLLVTPAQAESLTLANNEGRIQLVLRNATDRGDAPTVGKTLRELYNVAAKPAPVAVEAAFAAGPRPLRRAPPPPPAVSTPPARVAPTAVNDEVLVIRGTQKTIEAAMPGKVN